MASFEYTNAGKLTQACKTPGNNIDPLMGTVLAQFNAEAVKNCKLFERTKLAEQDGADFYVVADGRKIARYEYPFASRNDWFSLEAAQEAAAMFLRDNPEYKLVSF